MARKFLTPIDLALNELRNAVIQVLASAPGSPVAGQIYYDSTLHEFGYYNGTGWVYPGSSGGGSVTTVSVATANGFAGSVANATSTPAITLTTSVSSGLLKASSSAIVAATSGTDYAPATATTSALKGNGSGGFSAAVLNDVGAATGDYSLNSHKLTSVSDPTGAQDAATKNYVDATVQGLQFKPTATVAATSALPAGTYSNGSSGVGATFTVTATGTTTVDSHVLALADLVLVTAQASAFQNGLYTVTTAGTGGVSTVLTRHADMDQAAEFPGAMVPAGSTGTVNANSLWLANPSGTVTVGTTNIPFTELNKGTDLAAGTGITITGNSVALTTPVAAANGGAGTVSGILKANGSGTVSSAKFTATIGDGSTTAIAVTHSLSTQDVIAQVRDASTNAVVECDITQTSTSVTTFTFATAPASNAYKVVIIG